MPIPAIRWRDEFVPSSPRAARLLPGAEVGMSIRRRPVRGAGRGRPLRAGRREAITWRRSRNVDTPPAYWSYLRRYPRGAHSDDARRRLAYLSAAFEPPPRFTVITYDVPPPPPEEVIYVERRVLVFDDPDFGFAPPPPPPILFLPPRPA